MTRGQRWIILIGLPTIAWLLHVTHVDWHFRRDTVGSDYIICWREKSVLVQYAGGLRQQILKTGIHPQDNVMRSGAVVYGIVIPLMLVTLDVWLWLGWRRRGRIAHGLCGNCGHDLRGADHDRCPECGTPAAKF